MAQTTRQTRRLGPFTWLGDHSGGGGSGNGGGGCGDGWWWRAAVRSRVVTWRHRRRLLCRCVPVDSKK